jgi:hypothetical protein
MSASSSLRSRSDFAEASYAVNWRAIWAAAGIVAVFIATGFARLFLHSADPSADEPSVAHGVSPAAHRQILPPRAIVPQRTDLTLADSTSKLESPIWPNASIKKSATLSPTVTTAPVEPTITSAEIAAAANRSRRDLRDPIHVFDDPPNRLWPETAYPRTPGALAEDLKSRSVELDLPSLPDIAKEAAAHFVDGRENTRLLILSESPSIVELASRHSELAGLPFRRGAACRKSADEAKLIKDFSLPLHRFTDMIEKQRSMAIEKFGFDEPNGMEDRKSKLATTLSKFLNRGSLREKDQSSILVQMLQPFGQSVRMPLVKYLSEIKTASATVALAERAIYDLSPTIRKSACEALRTRPRAEYYQLLLDGLRYPWAPVAFHTAQALVALDDRQSLPHLDELLGAPDPTLPIKNQKGEWVKTELVRINHLRNCYLCHAPSTDKDDLVRGVVPIPGEPLPRIYYNRPVGNFVRADVTYLKQDFSVTQQVATKTKTDRWPEFQRFDYVARTRPATDEEIADVRKLGSAAEQPVDYPQRLAVMFAIEGLMQPPRSERPRPAVAANK